MSAKTIVFDTATGTSIDAEPEDLSALGTANRFLWFELDGDSEELRDLQEPLGLHPLAVEDALHAHQRPKIEPYGDQAFVVAYVARDADGKVGLHELSLFVSRTHAVTLSHDPEFALDALRDRLGRALKGADHPGAAFVYVLLDQIVDGYFDAVDAVGDRIDKLEEALLWSSSRELGLDLAFGVRRDIIYFRRAVAPLREVLNVLLRRDEEFVDTDLEPYLRDLYDHVVRVYEELDTDHDLVSAALEAHLSVLSTNMNEIVLKVSGWAAIIALPTVIASIYGMNFDHMPELHWYLGYPAALGLMASSSLALYLYFHGRHWI